MTTGNSDGHSETGLSGTEWTISHGDQEAVITELGGGLRAYRRAGRDLIHPFEAGTRPDAARGQQLIPWPNRIRDGKYSFGDTSQQLAISDPKTGNAIHGLVRWTAWQLRERTVSSLTVGVRLLAAQGWSWPLDIEIRYELDEEGLSIQPQVTNIASAAAPFGYGAHPYLTAGESSLDEASLTVPADTRLVLDERLLPVGTEAVSGDYDFRQERPLRGVVLDMAFTDIAAQDNGIWEVTLRHGERSTTLWGQIEAFGYVQCFTADTLPASHARVSGLAVEPMTCPVEAFNTGQGLLVLEPGETWSGRWGIRGN